MGLSCSVSRVIRQSTDYSLHLYSNFQALEYLLRHQHPHRQPPLPSLRFQDIREAIRRLDTAKASTVRPESHSAQRRF